MLEFCILGPLEVTRDGGAIKLAGPKQRATLAILLLGANRVVSIDRLADDLYAGAAPVTAVTQVQRQISELRKALGPGCGIETRAPGYVLTISPDQLDLRRFEQVTEAAGRALARGEARRAGLLQREALELWRGPPLADVEHEPFAQIAIERLAEIKLAALEQRIDADLALGLHKELVGELDELVARHPFHESFSTKLMLALYRSGRQAEALDVFHRARESLVESFGIEPGPELRALERAILNHDPALELKSGDVLAASPAAEPESLVLVLPSDDTQLVPLLTVAEPLTRQPGRSLLVARLLPDDRSLAATAASLSALRPSLPTGTRTATFTSLDPADDAVRLATTYGVQLVVLDAPSLAAGVLPDGVGSIVERSPADVAVLAGRGIDWDSGEGVFVPFAGGEHDWTALELGARFAASRGIQLRLIGAKAEPFGRRDASRLLASASLAVQRAVGVDALPVLVEHDPEAVVEAVARATLVLIGLSPRWRREGLGEVRRALVRGDIPALLVHSGPRPSTLAPAGSRTRYTWSINGGSDYLQGVSTAAT
jgi:DNA-binding SARP family transcriptional activator